MELLFFFLLCSSVSFSDWTPPVLISLKATNAATNENMGQTIATSGQYVHVVYSDVINSERSVWYRRSSDGGLSWDADTPIRLSPTPVPLGDSYPLLAVVGSNVHVVWLRNQQYPIVNQGSSVYRNSTDNGKTWNVETDLGVCTFWPGVAAAGPWVYVTINGHDSQNHSQVYFRRSSNNGISFLDRQAITNGVLRSEDPAMSAFGNSVHIVWNDNRNGIMEFYYIRSLDNGATWGPETDITPQPQKTYTPTIFASSNTDLAVAYGDELTGAGAYRIMSQTSTDNGDHWNTPYDHSGADGTTDVYPSIVQAGTNVHIFSPYNLSSTSSPLMYSMSKDKGQTFSTPFKLVTGTQPFLALSGSVIHAIYTDKSTGVGQIYYLQNPTGNF